MKYVLAFLIAVCGSAYAESSFEIKKLSVNEVFEEPQNEELYKHVHGFLRLCSDNFTPDSKFTLFSKGLGQRPRKIAECTAGENGELYFEENHQNIPLATRIFAHGEFMPGEAAEYILRDMEGKEIHHIKTYPIPLQASDEEGRQVTLEVATADRLTYEIHLKGFKPEERLHFTSKAGGEIVQDELQVAEDGTLWFGLRPGVKPGSYGKGTIKVTLEESENEIALSYEWGHAPEA